jgi:hypothetical protein
VQTKPHFIRIYTGFVGLSGSTTLPGISLEDIPVLSTNRCLVSEALCACLLVVIGISFSAGAQTTAPNEWTWMAGGSTDDQPGVYGTLGAAASTNIPGGRYFPAIATDSNGHLWLFGGDGVGGYLNDLWEFNPSTNQWAWMGGNSTVSCATLCGNSGVYGTLNTPAAGNVPGSRQEAASWIDQSGNFWLFGGQGFDANGTLGYLNDLWEFNPSTKQWAWVSGNSTVPTDNGEGYGGQPGV